MTTDDRIGNLNDDDLKKRIEDINRMVLEVAGGNFAYKLAPSDNRDELDGLIVGLNMMVEELKASKMSRGYLSPEYKHVAGIGFVIDENLTIHSSIPTVAQTLHFDANELSEKSLSEFVTNDSKAVLENLKDRIAACENELSTIELCFKTKKNLVLPAYCSVAPLANAMNDRRFLVLAIETIAQTGEGPGEADPEHVDPYYDKKTIYFSESDISKVNEVQDLLLENLQTQWSLSYLADKVGIDKRKLTAIFKIRRGKTVMEFLQDERMKKACSLLLNEPSMQLKEIAFELGYKNPYAFSKAFKKRFKVSPQDFRKHHRK